MQETIEIVGLYFFIEIVVRFLFKNNYRDIRYLTVFTIFLFFLFFLHYISWKDIATPLIYIYILLFIIGFLLSQNYPLLFQAVLFAPVVEEIICRQYIFEKLSSSHLSLAFIVSIFFFLIFHFPRSWQQSLYIIICGLILCLIQMKTGKVGNSIAIHGLINLCVIMI